MSVKLKTVSTVDSDKLEKVFELQHTLKMSHKKYRNMMEIAIITLLFIALGSFVIGDALKQLNNKED